MSITSTPTIRIDPGLPDGPGDRFHRFGLISWWDQKKLASARILVVGAGALGNEIVKNLSLLGIGNVLIADMDRIENSNLSRSVLYREAHNGRSKADIAAEAAREIYPQIRSHSFSGNIVHDLGLGVFRWADIVIGGVDNREARLAINRNCYKVGRPWIDGAIEVLSGLVRVFVPDGPCYECTMTALDWKLLQARRSCNLLSRDQMQTGKTPTTPTISSIIAGLQCQETVKYLHGMETMRGTGWIFDGTTADASTVQYQRKSDCCSHETLKEIIPVDFGVASVTARQLLDHARSILGAPAHLELSRDILSSLTCPRCRQTERIFASLGKVPAAKAFCPHCPQSQRDIQTFYKIWGQEEFLDMTLAELGVPLFDIVIARSSDGREIGLELAGDAVEALGPLAESEGLQWT